MIHTEYNKQVQPVQESYIDSKGKKKKQWVGTRADKHTRYFHFELHKGDISLAEKERWSIDLLKMALSRAERPVLSCSFGIDSIVQLHLARRALVELGRDPSELAVIWNNTLNEFQEVRVYAKQMTEEWNLNLIETKPKKPLLKIINDNGGIDSSYFTARKGARGDGQPLSEKCCNTLKHEPMNRASRLHQWDLIIAGLRGDESSQRKIAGLRDGEYFYSVSMWKSMMCRPILWWKEADIWNYVEQENIPYNGLYDKNMIKVYPSNTPHLVESNKDILESYGIDVAALKEQQITTVSRKQSALLKDIGFKVFTPRTGCQMCPIPVKYGYLQWMRTYYPKVYDAMVHKLGYGKALLDMIPQEVKDELKELAGIDVTAENAHEHLKEILQAKPCVFDAFE
ncbi:phosphoadenosine phosphosulfate reductase [Bacillus phage Eldridge]|uniref:Phosphoadenosine phosphosulfate reductase n=1 Tax=Bacillus phage Eldridge TaxID=1776293 RepID=A0A109Z8C1_9CAUD|nr:phosphoadenosine phosphosulfate reductase [Bacillus phage Eldridge]AMB18595.1 phosphoadenosine phosphosulfate reductase [Bacillus phage Eldridge]